jgi:hypothetical protein
MKLIHQCSIAIGIFIALSASFLQPAWADVMPCAGGTNELIFRKAGHKVSNGRQETYVEKNIVLDREKLTITLNEREARVNALFWLKNTSSSPQWREIAFPLGGGVGTGIVIDPTSFSATGEGRVYYKVSASSVGSPAHRQNPFSDKQKQWPMSFPLTI